MQQGKVLKIFIAANEGEPMISLRFAKAIEGVGLEGDRYAKAVGAYSKSRRATKRHVTLIALEAIEKANAELLLPFDASETRRNIVTVGIALSELIGKKFAVGEVLMRGVEICESCERPSAIAGKSWFARAFRGSRGGIRAEILTGGAIRVNDTISAS